MSSHTEQIKERLGIVDVVSSYMKLEKAGANFRARCPFHNEKTPSFMVSPTRNTYYCFGCGAKGDIFSFVEQFEGTDFKGALSVLADRAGVTLRPVDRKEEDKKARLYGVLEAATVFFERTLKEYSEAKAYLKKRGITSSSITHWRIGYAAPEWRELSSHLESLGYTKRELLDVGLIKESEKGSSHYDRFRGRLMFPIMDAAGRVVGYSGRILPDPKNSEFKEDSAKYINSPETSLYEKSHTLYGYHLAKHSIRKHDFAILVEGQMDVVLSQQAGFTNTLAASGTALTPAQLTLLSRLSTNLVMAFDADAAGIAAGGRGIDLALTRGFDVKVAALPTGSDPADLIVEDKEKWREVVRSAKHVIDFYLDHLTASIPDKRKLRLAVGRTVLPYLAHIQNTIDQAHFIETISSRLGISEGPLWESVKSLKKANPKSDSSTPPHSISREETSRSDAILTRLIGVLLWQEEQEEEQRKLSIEELRKELLTTLSEKELHTFMIGITSEKDHLLFEIEQLYTENENLEQEVYELHAELKKEHFKEKYQEALIALKQAEEKGIAEEVEKALSNCRKLSEAMGQ